jgi:hypothetical protein
MTTNAAHASRHETWHRVPGAGSNNLDLGRARETPIANVRFRVAVVMHNHNNGANVSLVTVAIIRQNLVAGRWQVDYRIAIARTLGTIPSWPHIEVEHMQGPCSFKVSGTIRPRMQALLAANSRESPNARDTAPRNWLHLRQKQSSFRSIGSFRARIMLIALSKRTRI